jgi:hypothetical protein
MGRICSSSTCHSFLGSSKGSFLIHFFSKLMFFTECWFSRHPPNFSWLHPNSHNLLSPPPSFPNPRFIILATISYHFLSSPRITHCATYCDGLKIPGPIDPVALTEALPFLVCTVGFDKPLRLARDVFGHEHLLLRPCVEGLLVVTLPWLSPISNPIIIIN